ncbi:hypothetical protein D3C77_694510 [compost metagenome]
MQSLLKLKRITLMTKDSKQHYNYQAVRPCQEYMIILIFMLALVLMNAVYLVKTILTGERMAY